MGKFLGILLAIALVVGLVWYFTDGFKFGGDESGVGNGETKQEQNIDTEGEKDSEVEEKEELSKVVTVTIKGDKVYVGNKEFTTEAELKAYIEEINNDEREFKLKDEESILETYEWVTKVFKDLSIQLVPVEE